MKPPITKCPHCGNDYDFYTKDYIQGSCHYNYRFNGFPTCNGEMYENTTRKSGKYAYCGECDKRLFKMSDNED